MFGSHFRIQPGLIFNKVQVVLVFVADCFELIVASLDNLVHGPEGSHERCTMLIHKDAMDL
jgi:hypothetical protein